jgi:glyceraldehyde 3-phosphate dehydrogenase
MTIKVAINGYGRIGRNVLRAIYEANRDDEIKVVAINNLANLEADLHLTKYDTTHGRFNADLRVESENTISVNGDIIYAYASRDPRELPWKMHDIDVVMECTGAFTQREKAAIHLESGAKKVLISAPAEGVDATIVYGINDNLLRASHTIISNASCTTNCLVPVVKPLHDVIGIEQGLMTTVHAYTNDQVLIDANHQDLRRARSATMSMIPTKTGAAKAVDLVLPELVGRFDGYAVRVPTINVSMVDLTFIASRETTTSEVNDIMKNVSMGALKGIVDYNTLPLVSVDFNHHPASAIFDATQTRVQGKLVKIVAWYDNEWGFSNRMIDTAIAMMKAQ